MAWLAGADSGSNGISTIFRKASGVFVVCKLLISNFGISNFRVAGFCVLIPLSISLEESRKSQRCAEPMLLAVPVASVNLPHPV